MTECSAFRIETELPDFKLKATCPSMVKTACLDESSTTTFKVSFSEKTMGREAKVWGQMGETIMAFNRGLIMGPPAARQ